jgi:hypothetical protein
MKEFELFVKFCRSSSLQAILQLGHRLSPSMSRVTLLPHKTFDVRASIGHLQNVLSRALFQKEWLGIPVIEALECRGSKIYQSMHALRHFANLPQVPANLMRMLLAALKE